jgi:hypothetical protein
MAGDGLGQGAAGPLGRGEMDASFRFVECQANGQSVFRKPEARGGCERGEGKLRGTKTDRGGPMLLERDAGGRGSNQGQGQAKKSTKADSGRTSFGASTKHSTWPHHTPCVTYTPSRTEVKRRNGEAKPGPP